MNHSRSRGERRRLSCHAIVEAPADVDQHVALLDRAIDVHPAVHSRHADAERMILGECADAMQGGHHRNSGPLGEHAQLGDGAGDDHAMAGENERF